jgi:hypothetical protein
MIIGVPNDSNQCEHNVMFKSIYARLLPNRAIASAKNVYINSLQHVHTEAVCGTSQGPDGGGGQSTGAYLIMGEHVNIYMPKSLN